MRNDIIEYELKLSQYRSSIYKAYFPIEMSDVKFDPDRNMLIEWAQAVARDMDSIGYKEVPLKSVGFTEPKDPPELLLWMGNYINDEIDPVWQVAVSSSSDGITAKEISKGHTESLFMLTAKREYLTVGDAQVIKSCGVLSMCLTMHGKLASHTGTVANPIMGPILGIAMSRYAEVAAKYDTGILYRDGLKLKEPRACRSEKITFSLE